jgi:hypothetical protein
MIVTCESDPAEVEALSRCCAGPGTEDRAQWSMLGRLRAGQAVALPVTEEAGGELRLFSIGPRLTPHVRHREKYVDVPVTDHHAFVFASSGGSVHRARTLRQFAQELGQVPQRALEGFLRRGDFSRWIGEVFGDHALASDLQGGTFLALGAFISSLTKNQIVAGALTFGLFLMLWVLDWVNAYSTSTVGKVCQYIAIAPHFEQFSRGVIELKDVVYYVSAIGIGLFLSKRSLESLRWRS